MLLRYPYEVRNSAEYFDDIQDVKITKDMLDLAKHIVQQKSGHFDPAKFEDHYEAALTELINKKRNGERITSVSKPVSNDNVISLMDALKRSISGKPAAAAKARGCRRSPPRARSRARRPPASARCCCRSPASAPPRRKKNARRRKSRRKRAQGRRASLLVVPATRRRPWAKPPDATRVTVACLADSEPTRNMNAWAPAQ